MSAKRVIFVTGHHKLSDPGDTRTNTNETRSAALKETRVFIQVTKSGQKSNNYVNINRALGGRTLRQSGEINRDGKEKTE